MFVPPNSAFMFFQKLLFSQVLFFCFWLTLQNFFAFDLPFKKILLFQKKKKKSISETVKINRNKLTLAFSVTFKFFDIWLIIFLKWFHKVCIIRLVHICFEKSSSTFWQVHCCAQRIRHSCQECRMKIFSNFVAFSENPNFNKSFILNAPLVSCSIPVIRSGWVQQQTGNPPKADDWNWPEVHLGLNKL